MGDDRRVKHDDDDDDDAGRGRSASTQTLLSLLFDLGLLSIQTASSRNLQ